MDKPTLGEAVGQEPACCDAGRVVLEGRHHRAALGRWRFPHKYTPCASTTAFPECERQGDEAVNGADITGTNGQELVKSATKEG